MKNYITLVFCLLLVLIISCDNSKLTFENNKIEYNSKKTIIISGSTTIAPIFKLVQNEKNIISDNFTLKIIENGSNRGLKDIENNTSDIIMSSKKISSYETKLLNQKKINLEEVLIAVDAITIIVNYKNKVKKITSTQIDSIFSGKIKNWSELGGENYPIKLVSRNLNSGTYSYFIKHIINNLKLDGSTLYFETNNQVLDYISNNVYSISYSSLLNSKNVDKLNIAFDQGGKYVTPSIENTLNHKYRFNRGLYIYYNIDKKEKLEPFLNLIKNGLLNKYIQKSGYIPNTLSINQQEFNQNY